MTKADIIDILSKEGIRANCEDDNVNHAVMILTDKPVPDRVKNMIDMLRPAGIAYHYAVKNTLRHPVPTVLHKWYRETAKAMKDNA